MYIYEEKLAAIEFFYMYQPITKPRDNDDDEDRESQMRHVSNAMAQWLIRIQGVLDFSLL